METGNKIEVYNPICFFNTVGQELEEIIAVNNISYDVLSPLEINLENISTITKFSKSRFKEIARRINLPEIQDYLENFQANYLQSFHKANISYKENLKIYRQVRHLFPLLRNEFTEGIDVLEDISDFLGIENEKEIFERVRENIALYKITSFEADNLNLYAWLKRGELDFRSLNLPNYNKDALITFLSKSSWQRNISDPTFLMALPNIFKSFGVGLIYTPYLEKTVYGAVRWYDNKPLVQVSDRNRCLATTWYTLLHELGHVVLHENAEIFEGNIDLPKSQINKQEQQANDFAYQYLFNGDSLRKYVFKYRATFLPDSFISETARQFNVNTMFVAYWMKKAQIRNKNLNNYIPKISFEE